MYNICSSFGAFKNKFFKINNNFEKAHILKNAMFKRGARDGGILCESFFGRNLPLDEKVKIAKLKFEDFFDHRRAKQLETLNEEFNLNFSLVTYMRIHEALQFYKNSRRGNEPKLSQSLDWFLKSFEKGSKPYRRILETRENSNLDILSLNLVTTFCNTISCPKPEAAVLRQCWGDWNNSFYTNRCREFLFKFQGNILGTNQRESKFVDGHDPRCTLCVRSNQIGPHDQETFLHVFFSCPVLLKYRNVIIERLFPELLGQEEQTLKLFWFFGLMPNNKKNLFTGSVISLANFLIWERKLLKGCVPVTVFLSDIEYNIFKLIKSSTKIREAKIAANYVICRREFKPP